MLWDAMRCRQNAQIGFTWQSKRENDVVLVLASCFPNAFPARVELGRLGNLAEVVANFYPNTLRIRRVRPGAHMADDKCSLRRFTNRLVQH